MNHNAVNSSTALKRIRSANEPTISAPVMPANVDWNAMNTYSGSDTPAVNVGDSESLVTPCRNSLSKLPMKALPLSNARL